MSSLFQKVKNEVDKYIKDVDIEIIFGIMDFLEDNEDYLIEEENDESMNYNRIKSLTGNDSPF